MIQIAENRGWISAQAPNPKLSTQGQKSKPRSAFTHPEIGQLVSFMAPLLKLGRGGTWREMRELIKDYVEPPLLYTGMRHGTEAKGLRWCDVGWHEEKGQQYQKFWGDGKTSGHFILAKHAASPVLQRLLARQIGMNRDILAKLPQSNFKHLMFRSGTGYQPHNLNGAFQRLMRDSGLLNGVDGQNRTLYLNSMNSFCGDKTPQIEMPTKASQPQDTSFVVIFLWHARS